MTSVSNLESVDKIDDDFSEYREYKAGLKEFAKIGGGKDSEALILFMNFGGDDKVTKVKKMKKSKSNKLAQQIERKKVDNISNADISNALEADSSAEIEKGEFSNLNE